MTEELKAAMDTEGKLKQILNTIIRVARRHYLLTFRMDYVLKSIARRKGKCNKCSCCKYRLLKCKHYDTVKNECKLYPNFPKSCKYFPIDKEDIAVGYGVCGFYWEEE